MSDVQYFQRYSQPENVVTNNTLLLLLKLHQYNRFKFEKFITTLCADQEVQFASPWLQFRQQKTTGKSIVDGFISQDSIKIAVETKLTDAFAPMQLENHLAVFGTEQNKLLILLSPSLGEVWTRQLASVKAMAMQRNIQVIHTSFEDIVKTCRRCISEHDEEMLALIEDYESFCSEWSLLPRDKYTVFAPPCRVSFGANIEFRLYYCPVARTVRKAKYLGIYADKSVRAIGIIAKVLVCNVDVEAGRVTVADESAAPTQEEEQRILGASLEAREHNWDLSRGHKFYVCDALEQTDFRKTSPGGIMGHRYLDLEELLGPGSSIPSNVTELAALLRQHVWE